MISESELGHNFAHATKNISCAKGKGEIDPSTVTI